MNTTKTKKRFAETLNSLGLPAPKSYPARRYRIPAVSNMTGKLAGIKAINTSPLDNAYCRLMATRSCLGTICRQCYSRKMLLKHRKNARPGWILNGLLLSGDLLAEEDLPRFKPGEVVRFNGHGELINLKHAINLLAIVRANPKARVAWWTKRPSLVRDAIAHFGGQKPDNLVLIYSWPEVIWGEIPETVLPEHFDKVFFVVAPGADLEAGGWQINCGSKRCKDCMLCYTPGDRQRAIIERLK